MRRAGHETVGPASQRPGELAQGDDAHEEALAGELGRCEESTHAVALGRIVGSESAQLVEEYGPVFGVPRLRRVGGLAQRVRGLSSVWSWERYEPAFPWRVDGRTRRLVRQVAKLDPVQLTDEQRRFGREVADVKRRPS